MNNSPTQTIGACIILLNAQDEMLMGMRKNSYGIGLYGFPGGRVELNEPLERCILREVKEETGIVLETVEYVGVVRENQGDYDFIHLVFAARNIDQEPQLCEPEKCEGWEWVPMNNEEKTLLVGHCAALELFVKRTQLIDITV